MSATIGARQRSRRSRAPALSPAQQRRVMRNRHYPRLCRSCQAPMGRQDDTCWRCLAPIRRSDASRVGAPYGYRSRIRRPHHSDALSRLASADRHAAGSRRESRAPVPRAARLRRGDATSRLATVPSRAENSARWRRERRAALARATQETQELSAAIDAAEARYRRLRKRLDAWGIGLAAVRARLCVAAT